MNLLKSEKGSATLLVFMTCLFFLLILVGLYISTSNTKVSQLQEVGRIKEIYEADVKRIDQIYDELVAEKAPEAVFLSYDVPYEENGLIAYYDGIDNSSNGHNSNATSWKDKSGNGKDINISAAVLENAIVLENNSLKIPISRDFTDATIEFTCSNITINNSTKVPFTFYGENQTKLMSAYFPWSDRNIYFECQDKRITGAVDFEASDIHTYTFKKSRNRWTSNIYRW